MDTAESRLYGLLRCPRCGAAPAPANELCPGCGRTVISPSGGVDLLDDGTRAESDRFAERYHALRVQEGWVDDGGREDPRTGNQGLWRGRLQAVAQLAASFESALAGRRRPVVADVGSGGGWAAELLTGADVIAIDLQDVASPSALHVRGDMRSLPLRDATVDVALYAASLHYADVTESVPEAARVLTVGGLLAVIDSPIYPDPKRRTHAARRAAAYYRQAGFPELASRYHPIEAGSLRSTLIDSGFRIERFEFGSRRQGLLRRRPYSLVIAVRLP
jgi:SAM-dependent methyltransferase